MAAVMERAFLSIRDRLDRVYSAPSKRLAPDLPFQSQLYRADGETLRLPAGSYSITYSGGPEYRVLGLPSLMYYPLLDSLGAERPFIAAGACHERARRSHA